MPRVSKAPSPVVDVVTNLVVGLIVAAVVLGLWEAFGRIASGIIRFVLVVAFIAAVNYVMTSRPGRPQ